MQLKMKKKKIEKEDGRYLIYYEFEENGQPSKKESILKPTETQKQKSKGINGTKGQD